MTQEYLNCGTGHLYNPMTPDTCITYQVFNMTGTWNDLTSRLDIVSSTPTTQVKITYSKNGADTYNPAHNLFVHYFHALNEPGSPVNYASALQDTKWLTPNGYSYIGELINELGNVIVPPEAKIQKNLVGGTVIEAKSVVRKSVTDNTIINPSFRWKYRCIEHMAAPWGDFIDCWRTGLREYITESGGPKDRVYNYLWMRDKGLVNFWYGDLNTDGTVTGSLFYAIEY
jgi:hypothetical protein